MSLLPYPQEFNCQGCSAPVCFSNVSLRSTLRQPLPSTRVTGLLRYYKLIRLPTDRPVSSCFSTCSRTAVAESIGSHLSPCPHYRSASPTSTTPEEDVNSHLSDLPSVACDRLHSLGFLNQLFRGSISSVHLSARRTRAHTLSLRVTASSPMGRYRWMVSPCRTGLPC
jgi:hypothetical protein